MPLLSHTSTLHIPNTSPAPQLHTTPALQSLTEGNQDTLDLQQALHDGTTLTEALDLARNGRWVFACACACV